MWHEPQPPKPFYLRAWFLTLTALVLLTGLAAGGAALYIQQEYGAKAKTLDLSKLQDMESASIVYDRSGKLLGKIYIQNRDTIPLNQMPYELVQALVAAEDNRFFQHHGIDYLGMARAMMKNWRAGKIRQGASTVTQQLARNTYPDVLPSGDRSFRRKALEAFVAMRIEENFSKSQILEFYFNRVYFGAGFYGAEAAARGYFGKSAKDLTLSECATLTGLLKSPTYLSPWRNRQACLDSRDFVLGRMAELGMITPAQKEAALNEKLGVKNRTTIYSESYAVEFVRQQVAGLIGDDDSVYGDGYRIYTTIDNNLQQTAENVLKSRLEEVEHRREFEKQGQRQTYAQYDALYRQRRKRADNDPLPGPSYLQGALYALDNSTGGVLALVGGRDFSHNQFNRALLANRPPGSGFLPLVYATAFEKGIFPGSIFQDAVMDNRQVMIGGLTGILGEWGPERADNQYEGLISAHNALVKSKNAATVRLGMATGIDNVLSLAKNAGISHELRHFPATYLGSSETTLADLTLAFSIFPGAGTRPSQPFVIQRVEQKSGRLVYEHPALRKIQVIKPTTAYEVHSALADSLERGSADRAYSGCGLKKFPLGGKTGTAYNFTDAWFIGYSSEVTCGVWAGFDSPQPIYRGAFSNEVAMPIWVDFMNASFSKFVPQEIPRPAELEKYEICRSSGLLATERCVETTTDSTGESNEHRTTDFEWGTVEQAPKTGCDVHGGGEKSFLKTQKPSNEGIPRAPLAVDLTRFTSVFMKSPTVLGDDPYSAIKNTTVLPAEAVDPTAVKNLAPTPSPTPADTEPREPQVRRAEPAGPVDQQPSDGSIIQIEPPPPMQF